MEYNFTEYEKAINNLSKLGNIQSIAVNANLIGALETMSSYLSEISKINTAGMNTLLKNISPSLTYSQNYYKNLENVLPTFTSVPSFTYSGKAFQAMVKKLDTSMSLYRNILNSDYFTNLLDSYNRIFNSQCESSDEKNTVYEEENDYVIVDEAPIKEWIVPDTIAIPIGHNRICMKTDIFIALIGSIILPLIFGIAGLIVDLSTASAETENESKRIEIEEERNELIEESNQLFSRYLDIIDSTDVSNSSKADLIESWKESLPRPDSVPITAGSVPDQTQESHNSNPE